LSGLAGENAFERRGREGYAEGAEKSQKIASRALKKTGSFSFLFCILLRLLRNLRALCVRLLAVSFKTQQIIPKHTKISP
jgi:hypothetical protein